MEYEHQYSCCYRIGRQRMPLRQGEQANEAEYHHKDVQVAEVGVFDEVLQPFHGFMLLYNGFNTDAHVGDLAQRIFAHILFDDKVI